jgi:Na+-transporting methylmalonyl-CoA/oxaloacetate decarboxylase gamma subunit
MGTLLKILAFGVAGIIGLGIVLTVVGLAVGIATFLLFKVVPILLVGWLIMKVVAPKKEKVPEISESDRKWLES